MKKKKLRKYFLFFRYLHLKMLLQIVSIKTKILVTSRQLVNKEF